MNLAFLKPSSRFLAIVGSATALGLTIGLIKMYFRRKKLTKRKSYPKDTVVLHQFPHKKSLPSISPFCLKLETWLRMTNIKYQNEYSFLNMSSKGKMPWITLNGVDVADSQFCIEYLTQAFGKDLSDHLSQAEKSISRAFSKLCDESLRWCVVVHRYKYGKAEDLNMKYLMFLLIARRGLKQSRMQGYGLHTKNEIYSIGKEDLYALDVFIGNKKYLFGEFPCVEDATIFSYTSQIVFYDNGPFNEYLKNHCHNLMRHFHTIRETFWPEWKLKNPN